MEFGHPGRAIPTDAGYRYGTVNTEAADRAGASQTPHSSPCPDTWILDTGETLLHSPLRGMCWPQLIVLWQFPPFPSDPRLCFVVGGLQA